MTVDLVNTVTGEILDAPTPESHEGYGWDDLEQRWVPTSTDLVPLSETGIENASDPAVYVELALARAKSWIADALQHGDIDQIVEIKAAGEAIRSYTAQRQLGKDVELSALEIVRRAERGLGLAIRKGQEAGVIAKSGDIGSQGAPGVRGSDRGVTRGEHLDHASDLVGLSRSRISTELYAVADGVSDERFEEVLTEAKAEGDLSRRNVVRKVKGEPAPRSTRPEHLRGTRHLNSARIIGETVDLVGNASDLGSLLEQVDFTTLAPALLEEWVRSLSKSISALRSLKNRLEKERTQHV